MPKLKEIVIGKPTDEQTYFVEKGNWTEKLKVSPKFKANDHF